MTDELAEGTTITCPLCRDERTTVKRNKNDKPYFYCAEYEAAVNMNAPSAHSDSFLREFVVEDEPRGEAGSSGESATGGGETGGSGRTDTTDIERRD